MHESPGHRNSSKIPKMKTPNNKKPDDFESVARRLECDEDLDKFEAKLSKIAKVKPNKDAARK